MNCINQSLTPLRLDFIDEYGEPSVDSEQSGNELVSVINDGSRRSAIEDLVLEVEQLVSKTPAPRKKRSSKDISTSGRGYPPLNSSGFGCHYGRSNRTSDGKFIPIASERSTVANPDSNWTTWSRCNSRLVGIHFPVYYTPEYMRQFEMKRRYCKVPTCRKQTSVYCRTCGVPLCITVDSEQSNCFINFHTKITLSP